MIEGRIVIEDKTMIFAVISVNEETQDEIAEVTVVDEFTSMSETYTCDAANLMNALSIALAYKEQRAASSTESLAAAELAQPKNKALRFIP